MAVSAIDLLKKKYGIVDTSTTGSATTGVNPLKAKYGIQDDALQAQMQPKIGMGDLRKSEALDIPAPPTVPVNDNLMVQHGPPAPAPEPVGDYLKVQRSIPAPAPPQTPTTVEMASTPPIPPLVAIPKLQAFKAQQVELATPSLTPTQQAPMFPNASIGAAPADMPLHTEQTWNMPVRLKTDIEAARTSNPNLPAQTPGMWSDTDSQKLARSIVNGAVSVDQLTPEQVPWSELTLAAQQDVFPVAQDPVWASIAELAARGQTQQAWAYLKDMTNRVREHGRATAEAGLTTPSVTGSFRHSFDAGVWGQQAPEGRTAGEKVTGFLGHAIGSVAALIAGPKLIGGPASAPGVDQAMQGVQTLAQNAGAKLAGTAVQKAAPLVERAVSGGATFGAQAATSEGLRSQVEGKDYNALQGAGRIAKATFVEGPLFEGAAGLVGKPLSEAAYTGGLGKIPAVGALDIGKGLAKGVGGAGTGTTMWLAHELENAAVTGKLDVQEALKRAPEEIGTIALMDVMMHSFDASRKAGDMPDTVKLANVPEGMKDNLTTKYPDLAKALPDATKPLTAVTDTQGTPDSPPAWSVKTAPEGAPLDTKAADNLPVWPAKAEQTPSEFKPEAVPITAETPMNDATAAKATPGDAAFAGVLIKAAGGDATRALALARSNPALAQVAKALEYMAGRQGEAPLTVPEAPKFERVPDANKWTSGDYEITRNDMRQQGKIASEYQVAYKGQAIGTGPITSLKDAEGLAADHAKDVAPTTAPETTQGTITPPQAETPSAAHQNAPQPLNRAELLRTANPGMDEKAIQDMVRTTANLSDVEFGAFAQRAGKPETGAAAVTATRPTLTATDESGQSSSLPQLTDNYVKPLSDYAPTMYREAGGENALLFIPGADVTAPVGEVFLANTTDMALGQGDNKGVLLEFNSSKLKGQVNTSKPAWALAYQDGQAEFIGKENAQQTYQDALQGITVKPDAKMGKADKVRLQTTLAALEKQGWAKTENEDGSVTYRRPAQTETPPIQEKQPESATPSKEEVTSQVQVSQNAPLIDLTDAEKAILETSRAVTARVLKAQEQQKDDLTRRTKEAEAWNEKSVNPAGKVEPSQRPQNVSINGAVEHVRRYYPELNMTKTALTEELKKPGALEFARKGSFNVGVRTGGWEAEGNTKGIAYDTFTLDSVDEWAAKRSVELQSKAEAIKKAETSLTITTPETVLPPATMLETKKPVTLAEVQQKAKAQADLLGTTLEKFMNQPDGYKGLLTNPQNSMARYWLATKMQDMGKSVPQKVSDLMVELHSTLSGQAANRGAEIRRVQGELDTAINDALRGDKTFVERLLDGEEPVALTGKKLPPGALEGKTAKAEPAKPVESQQGSIFGRTPEEQKASYRTELEGIRQEHDGARTQHDAMVQEVATQLAKDATKANEEARKTLWATIKDRGYIGPNKSGNREDFYGRLPATVNHLKRLNGTPLDVLATDLGYSSEDALIREIVTFSRMGKVTPADVRTEAEDIVTGTQAGANLKAQLNYYQEAERAVMDAMGGTEGNNLGGEAAASRPGAGRSEGGAAPAVSGEGAGGSPQGTGEIPAGQPQAELEQPYTLKDALSEQRGSFSFGKGKAPVDPLTQELDKSISWNDTKTFAQKHGTPKEMIRGAANSLVDNWFDSNAAIRRMQKALAGNQTLSTDMDAYLRMNLLPKAVPGYTEAKIKELEGAYTPLGDKIRDYFRYADALETLWRAKEFGYGDDKLPMPQATAQAFADRIEQGPDAQLFRKVFDREQALYDGMLQELKAAGMLSDEAIEKMRSAYGEKDAQGNIQRMLYVPMFRDMKATTDVGGNAVEAKTEGGTGQGRTVTNVPKATKAQHGSARLLMDPMERRIRYISRVMGVAERNKVGMALAKFAETFDANGDYMTKVAPPMEHVEGGFTHTDPKTGATRDSSIMRQLEDLGFDPNDLADPNATIEFFKPTWTKDKDIVTIYQDGKATYWKVKDPSLLQSIAGMDPVVTGGVTKLLQWGTQFYKTGATITPSFTIANLIRDTAESYILSHNQAVPGQALFEALRLVTKHDPFVQRTIDAGLKQGGWLRPERLSKDMLQQIADPRGTTFSVKTLFDVYQRFREEPEFWTRLGESSLEYKAQRKTGATDTDAFLRAMYEGGRITLNFTRGGIEAKKLNRLIPFFKIPMEAALRTSERIAEEGRPVYDPRNFWFKAILPATVMALGTVLLNKDNEIYKQASDSERDKYLLIPMGKALVRVPKPNGVFGVYLNLVERSLGQWMADDPAAFHEFGKNALGEMFPRISNPALELLVAVAPGHYSLEEGRPIVPSKQAKLSDTRQVDSRTSATVATLAPIIGKVPLLGLLKSPMVAQYAIDKAIPGYSQGYFTLEKWIRQATGDAPAPKPEDFVGRFYSRPGEGKQGRSVTLFYERLDKTETVYNDLRDEIQKQSGQSVDMSKLTPKQAPMAAQIIKGLSKGDRALLGQRKLLNQVSDRMGEYRKLMEAAQNSDSLTPEGKKQRIEAITRAITALADKAMKVK